MSAEVVLVVQSDDFGMCHAVNEGVVRAFEEGILTQASAMAPCPWFDEAAALAKLVGIPVGMHCTLTCDWDLYRWGPLTQGSSLTDDGIAFHSTVAAAAGAIDPDEAIAELDAQVERMRSAGVMPSYFDCHMGVVCAPAYQAVVTAYDRPFVYPVVERAFDFESIRHLSERPTETKKDWLLTYLSRREPGVHLLVSHVAAASRELESLASPSHPSYAWTSEYRTADLEVLCDPEVREAVEAHGIRLTSLADLNSG